MRTALRLTTAAFVLSVFNLCSGNLLGQDYLYTIDNGAVTITGFGGCWFLKFSGCLVCPTTLG